MALKPVDPRDDSRREQVRYDADLQDVKDRPYAWGNGPGQVPERIVQETVVFRTVERPAPEPDAPQPAPVPEPQPVAAVPQPAPVAAAPQPVPEAPQVPQGRPLSALPGVLIGPDGRAVPV